eukprot:scaffold2507_cov122-Isochrysis_galbana.AAC.17
MGGGMISLVAETATPRSTRHHRGGCGIVAGSGMLAALSQAKRKVRICGCIASSSNRASFYYPLIARAAD